MTNNHIQNMENVDKITGLFFRWTGDFSKPVEVSTDPSERPSWLFDISQRVFDSKEPSEAPTRFREVCAWFATLYEFGVIPDSGAGTWGDLYQSVFEEVS